jgi:ABC-2 type transport system ATP-binding protein
MEEADLLCDRLAIIDTGKIIVLGSPAELKRNLGEDVIVMKINNPNIEEVKKFGFVKKIETKNNLIYLTVMDANEHLPQIMQTIGRVESVEVRSLTLNDVFLHYTGKVIREESPEGGWAERVMRYNSNR